MNKIKNMFRGFKYRNFRLFFPGLAISQTGVWIQNIAISWLVYDITKSAFTMGTVMFFNTIPLFLITPFSGALVDKFNRHKLLIIIQSLFVIQSLLITITAFLGLLNIPAIIFFGVFLNIISAIDAPVRQSSYVLLVDDPKDLSNAISLNASCFNLARFIGPAIGGLIIGYFGVKYCFLVTFIFLLPSLFLIKAMKIKDVKTKKEKKENIFISIKEGICYSAKNPPIITAIIYLFLLSFLSMSYPMLLPIYTADILTSNADILGYLLGATGIGSLVTSLFLATKMSIKGLRTIIFTGCMFLGLAFICTGLTASPYIALIAMFFVGMGTTCFVTPQNVLVQTAVADNKRGRVVSLNSLAFLGTVSISSLFAGTVAQQFGIAKTFVILGISILLVSCFFSYKLSKFDYSKKLD